MSVYAGKLSVLQCNMTVNTAALALMLLLWELTQGVMYTTALPPWLIVKSACVLWCLCVAAFPGGL